MNVGVIQIERIIVLRQAHTADRIWLLPKNMVAPVWPFDEPARLQIECAKSQTEGFLNQHFKNVPVEMIDA